MEDNDDLFENIHIVSLLRSFISLSIVNTIAQHKQ